MIAGVISNSNMFMVADYQLDIATMLMPQRHIMNSWLRLRNMNLKTEEGHCAVTSAAGGTGRFHAAGRGR
jgi:hypothetical protein